MQLADEAIRGLDFLPLFEVCLEPIELGDLASELKALLLLVGYRGPRRDFASRNLCNRAQHIREIREVASGRTCMTLTARTGISGFQAQGIDEIGAPRGAAFDDSNLLLKAVLAGQGAGLVPAAMAALDLAQGRLVKLADVVWPEAFAYYLVDPEVNHERPKVAAFRTWILRAASDDPANALAGPAPTLHG